LHVQLTVSLNRHGEHSPRQVGRAVDAIAARVAVGDTPAVAALVAADAVAPLEVGIQVTRLCLGVALFEATTED